MEVITALKQKPQERQILRVWLDVRMIYFKHALAVKTSKINQLAPFSTLSGGMYEHKNITDFSLYAPTRI